MATPQLQLVDAGASEELQERETRIEEAERNGYLVRGSELREIRDKKLYAARYNFPNFKEYCEERWEFTEARASHLINSAGFATVLTKVKTPIPSREAHIRPIITGLDQLDDQIAAWRDVLATTNGSKVKTRDVEDAVARFKAYRNKDYVTLSEWHELSEASRVALLGKVGKKGLNKQDNRDIEWADWSWNPITGCLHGCPYCYARDIAFSIYPEQVGFAPTIWADRLTAPQNQKVPDKSDVAAKNIFTCSMADLFGRWVPPEWIEKVLSVVSVNPQWNFLFLTKFPKRMSEFNIPNNAWLGTTVDLQARVSNAERAFEKVKAPVRWLSIEPMCEPLKFKRLDLFDWVVIGGASQSKAVDGFPATPDWNPAIDWIVDLHQQARAAGCKIYYKTNSGLSDMTRIREFPGSEDLGKSAPPVFDYLRAVPKAEQLG
jgi:protein gp37